MEGAGLMTYTAASHQGATVMIWLLLTVTGGAGLAG